VVAYLFYPDAFCFRRAQVRIETTGTWTRGQTLMDRRHTAQTAANAWVAYPWMPTASLPTLRKI
jgi:inosine-uridine nucleoside N-ribohydrolase